eukprot:TRINITY_DN31933_c0_g1_i1.p1 TRINITY_DN31933_c0_g1~~TRINITY_DN31933_c0_g1_i1.p1  ORF type:complete len:575 (-),score=191.18 TRINITY_DN31933_c0_g1_i1:117-1841(-)
MVVAGLDLIAGQVLENKHLERLYLVYNDKWDSSKTMSAAMSLMKSNGVTLTDEEEQELASMDEREMVEALVQKMPAQTEEEFQEFFLQLQMLVATADKVREGFQAARADLVEEALNAADEAGLSTHTLKMGIVTAGREVVQLKTQHAAWVKDSEHRLSKLVRGQEDAMKARKKLAATQAQLQAMKFGGNERVMKVLQGMFGQNAGMTKKSVFLGWKRVAAMQKEEDAVYREFQDRIEKVEQQLIEYKLKQLTSVSNLLNNKVLARQRPYMRDMLQLWQEVVEHEKAERRQEEELAGLQSKLAAMQEEKTERVKAVMQRMAGESDTACVQAAFQAFVSFHKEYQQQKAIEDQVKQVEADVKKFMAARKGDGKSILYKMAAASDSATMVTAVKGWITCVKDAKMEAMLENAQQKASRKMDNFKCRAKNGAHGAMGRMSAEMDLSYVTRCFTSWRLDVRMEVLYRNQYMRIEGKKAQLSKVQGMFREFAVQLESGIKMGQDSERDLHNLPARCRNAPGGRKSLTKTDGSVSLPSIHSQKVPPSVERPSSRSGSGVKSGYGIPGGPQAVPAGGGGGYA